MGSDARVWSVRRRAFSLIRVRARPGRPPQGILLAGPLALPVVLGRGGIRPNKFGGDGATPGGRFRLIRLWWRADRHRHPRTLLPTHRITPDLAWCEGTTNRRDNRPLPRAPRDDGARLWRTDHLYDFVVEIDHNTRPRVAGRGSAVFMHVARPNRSPTAGCVALAANNLRRLLAALGPKTRIAIRY